MIILKKIARDLSASPGRVVMMVTALLVALSGFNTITSAGSILTREIVRNYMDSAPAEAILEFDEVSSQLVLDVAARSDVKAAVRRTQIAARAWLANSEEKKRAFVFVVDDFSDLPLAKISPQTGTFPPTTGQILVERSSLAVAPVTLNQELSLLLPSGKVHKTQVAGIVHEPALAPANTEDAIYVYVTAATLKQWGETPHFDELRLTVEFETDSVAHIEAVARSIEQWSLTSGHGETRAIRIPPPGRHPHQSQMTTILVMMSLFALLVVVLSSLLSASLFATFLSRQVREIAILKTMGARSSSLMGTYLITVEAIALLSFVPARFLSDIGAQLMSQRLATLLNFDLTSQDVAPQVRWLQLGVAVFLPLLACIPTVLQACRRTVREALNDHGVEGDHFGRSVVERWVVRFVPNNRSLAFALRGAVRRRARFLLAFCLMAVASGTLLASLSMKDAWSTMIERLYESRHYDLEVHFLTSPNDDTVLAAVSALTSTREAEIYKQIRTARASSPGIPIEHTYPDGGHGAFHIVSPPNASKMMSMTMRAGRFIEPGDAGVVINQMVPGADDLEVGETIVLSISGRLESLPIIGKAEEVGVGATAYLSRGAFDSLVKKGGSESILRISTAKSDAKDLRGIAQELEDALAQAGAQVEAVLPLAVFENAVAAHFQVLVDALLALAFLTALVGGLGLSSSMISSIVERTRELGILRALGATSRQIRATVIGEGSFVSLSSALVGLVLGAGLAFLLGDVVGQMSFRLPLPVVLSAETLTFSAAGLAILTLLSTLLAARRALSLTLKDSLEAL